MSPSAIPNIPCGSRILIFNLCVAVRQIRDAEWRTLAWWVCQCGPVFLRTEMRVKNCCRLIGSMSCLQTNWHISNTAESSLQNIAETSESSNRTDMNLNICFVSSFPYERGLTGHPVYGGCVCVCVCVCVCLYIYNVFVLFINSYYL
jgi:hypothetical protein